MKMNFFLRMKWELILLFQLKFATISHESIAGVTYMDDFDFEDRYRNVYECDPFHWHPLHLPEHCAEMYENLIRSGIAKFRPARVVRKQEMPKPVVYSLNIEYPTYEIPTYAYSPPNIDVMDPFGYNERKSSINTDAMDAAYGYRKRAMSSYDQMFELIRKDVERNPTAPVIEMMYNVGPVAVYRQPVSKNSKHMIKKISGAFAYPGAKNDHGKSYGEIKTYRFPKTNVETTTAQDHEV